MSIKRLLSVFVLLPLLMTSAALGDEAKEKKEGEKTPQQQDKQMNISTASGPRSCSATSGDGKKSCSVSCKSDEDAECSNTETDAECACK